ncbi:MAG: leucyl aminopeptidase, partial [Anaerolineae bacterium]
AEVEMGANVGAIVADATCLARDLVNRPANYATPTDLAELAMEIAGEFDDMRCQILSEDDAAELGMGAFLGVAQGSDEPAAFIVLEYNPEQPDLDTVVLVGKGITFDTGGISLKPAEKMDRMRGDMGGGAAVLAAMYAVGQLDLPLHVAGLVPATENMPSGQAYKPGDVLEAMNGKTIEVVNTDAEGRLVLADALAYAAQFEPMAVVDLATLTGACVVALGRGVAAGIFGTDDRLLSRLRAASEASGERLWPMPLYDDYLDKLESLTADLSNTGGRDGGVGTSAMFLKQFAEGYPWAHLDIAGMSFEERPGTPKRPPHLQKGGTGFGVRLLVQFLRDWAAGS